MFRIHSIRGFCLTLAMLFAGTAEAQEPGLTPAMVQCYGQGFAYCIATNGLSDPQVFPREMCSVDTDCDLFVSCIDGRCNTGLFVIVSAEDQPDPLYTISTNEGDTAIELVMDESVLGADLNGGFSLVGLVTSPPGSFIAPIEAGDIEFLGDWLSFPNSIPVVSGDETSQRLDWMNLSGADPIADAIIRINLVFDDGDGACFDDADCDDGIFCNGAEPCEGGVCRRGTSVCANGEACVEESQECIALECSLNADCDNLVFCDGYEQCENNQCVAGTPPCEAAGEACEEAIDDCVSVDVCSVAADCDDGIFCNGAETCDAGQCQAGTRPCGESEICLEDSDTCDAADCTEDAHCDNGRFCDGMETCNEGTGECVAGTEACGLSEICVEVFEQCVEAECIFNIQCDDGLFCNGDEICDAGKCRTSATSPCGAGAACFEEGDACSVAFPLELFMPPIISGAPRD